MLALTTDNGDGRAVIAPWIIRMLAGSFLVGAITWATWITTHQYAVAQDTALVKQREQDHFEVLKDQLDRMERKLESQ